MKKRNVFNNIKVSILNNKQIIIENYTELADISDEKIVVGIYTIIGDFLKITQMDSYVIKIEGLIKQIYIDV